MPIVCVVWDFYVLSLVENYVVFAVVVAVAVIVGVVAVAAAAYAWVSGETYDC